jgi:hypothetical protein
VILSLHPLAAAFPEMDASAFAELKKEMKETPDLFTHDLRFFLEKYEKQINSFLANLK